MKRTAVAVSVGLHIIVLNFVLDSTQLQKEKRITNQKLRVKFRKKMLKKASSNKGKGFSMKDLAPKLSASQNFNDYDAMVLDQGSQLNRYVAQIDQHLQYPDWLVKRNIQGHVAGHVMISRKKLISLSFKSTSRSLKNYVIFVLKRALDDDFLELFDSTERIMIPLTFQFELSTGLEEERIQTDAISFFYRHAYGGDEVIDEINQGVTTALGAIQNPLTLLKHRPDWMKSDKERTKELFNEKLEETKL